MDKFASIFDLFRSKRRLFLSYAREDHESVANLYRKLRAAGYRPWMDTENIPPGADWEKEIAAAIRGSDYFLACLSTQSLEQKAVLQREIQRALDIWRGKAHSNIYLLPVRLEKCDIPPSLAMLQWVDLFALDGWEKLFQALHGSHWLRRAAALLLVVLLFTGIWWALFRPGSAGAAQFVSLRPGGGAATPEPTATLIGVTAWELRYSVASDPPHSRAIIHPPPDPAQPHAEPEEYTPLRIPLQGALRTKTKFWLGIEVSKSGYLYVIDRELFEQTRRGDPYLIFPTARIRGGNSAISRGDLIRLPGEDSNPPYWVLQSNSPAYRGELVTVMLAPQPIAELQTTKERAPISAAWLDAYEKAWGAPVAEVFRGNSGGFAAPAELGPSPVLGSTDPSPENIYRIDVKSGNPVVMSVPVLVRR